MICVYIYTYEWMCLCTCIYAHPVYTFLYVSAEQTCI